MSDDAREFDCIECRRHMIVLCEPPDMPDICGICLHMPGWFNDPVLRVMLDPVYKERDG